MRIILTTALLTATSVSVGYGQAFPDQLNFMNSDKAGIHFYGVTGFLGYSSVSYPQRPDVLDRSRGYYGVSTTVGWQHLRGRTTILARYSGSYQGDTRNSDFNSLDHWVSISITRPLGSKWNASLAGVGQDLSLTQYVFQSTSLGSLSQSSASFDDLAAAFSVGQFSSSQSAARLGVGPDLSSPSTAALLGNQILTYYARASLTYEHSSRLQFQFGSFALGGQHRRSNEVLDTNVPNYIIPRTLGGNAGVQMNYLVSPRTDIGVAVNQNYTTTTLQKAYATDATASFGRKMGAHWFLRLYGGGSFTERVEQSLGAPPMRQMIGGGSIGFRTYANVLVATYHRTGSDISSASIGTNTNITAAWHWQHPHKSWGLSSAYTRNETSNTGFSEVFGWRVSAGLTQRLKGNFLLTTNYSYLRSRGTYIASFQEVRLQSVRLSISWVPHLKDRTLPIDANEQLQ